MILTLRTIPFVILVKLLRLGEFFQTVAKSDGTALFAFLRPLSTTTMLLKRFGGLELFEEFRGQLRIPDYLKDHIMLTSLIGVKIRVEADVRIDANLGQQVFVGS